METIITTKIVYTLDEIIENYNVTDDELNILKNSGVNKFIEHMMSEFDDIINIKYIGYNEFEFEY